MVGGNFAVSEFGDRNMFSPIDSSLRWQSGPNPITLHSAVGTNGEALGMRD
jgi:hypothetical protein